MKRRLMFSIAMLAIGAGLLVAAGFAGPSVEQQLSGQEGGTFKYSSRYRHRLRRSRSRVLRRTRGRSSTRPAEAAELPGCAGAPVAARPGGRAGYPDGLGGRQDVHLPVSTASSSATARTSPRRTSRAAIEPRPQPEDAVAGSAVPRRHRWREGRHRRQRVDGVRASRFIGQQLQIKLTKLPGHPGPARDAVLRARSRRTCRSTRTASPLRSSAGPYYIAAWTPKRSRSTIRAGTAFYNGSAAAQRRPHRRTTSAFRWRRSGSTSKPDKVDHGRSRRRRMLSSAGSTASTRSLRASTSSTRLLRSGTWR